MFWGKLLCVVFFKSVLEGGALDKMMLEYTMTSRLMLLTENQLIYFFYFDTFVKSS